MKHLHYARRGRQGPGAVEGVVEAKTSPEGTGELQRVFSKGVT